MANTKVTRCIDLPPGEVFDRGSETRRIPVSTFGIFIVSFHKDPYKVPDQAPTDPRLTRVYKGLGVKACINIPGEKEVLRGYVEEHSNQDRKVHIAVQSERAKAALDIMVQEDGDHAEVFSSLGVEICEGSWPKRKALDMVVGQVISRVVPAFTDDYLALIAPSELPAQLPELETVLRPVAA